jgi:hypothetical protein
MYSDQSTWRSHWQEISEQMQPRRARFYENDGKGEKRNQKIVNNTPLIAMRVAAAGMMAGLTSPARQWFRLTHPDPDILKKNNVKAWLYRREMLMTSIIAKSNAYNTLSGAVYPDLLAFGTHATFLEEDQKSLIRLYPQAIGEYVLASNSRGEIDTFARDVPFTVRQLVQKFGLKNCSANVQNAYDKGIYEQLIRVVHFVCPNEDYVPNQLGSKKYASYWFEKASENSDKFLRKAGYDRFPVLAPRWALTNSVSDVYGFCPGMDALGDCKELQHLEKNKAKLTDKLADPTLAVPEDMRNQRISLVPGDHVLVPRSAQGQRIEPIQVVAPQGLSALNELIGAVENRVAKGFYADLWLQITNDDRTQPRTAREIAERHEEKMLQLGPVVERAEDELLDPFIDYVFDRVDDLNLQEPPPDELAGSILGIEYISVMAQAQRLVNVSSTERFVSFVLGFSQAKPEALDKLNVDSIVEDMAATLGVNPDFVIGEDEVNEIRAARAEQEQAAQQGDAMIQGAKGLKDASAVDTDKLAELAQMMGGQAGAAQAGFGPPGGMPMN